MKNEPESPRIVKKRDAAENRPRPNASTSSRKQVKEEKQEIPEPYEDQMPNEILRVFSITLVSILGVALGALICWLTFEYLPK